ncbi:hypothetical protein ACVGW6_00150, partial [Enterobacter intestinihominis]
AYGMCVSPGGGYALPGLRDVRFAGWRLRLTRPTGCAFRRVAATPYPAYGLCVLPGGGCALPGLPDVRLAGWRLRLNPPNGFSFFPVEAFFL